MLLESAFWLSIFLKFSFKFVKSYARKQKWMFFNGQVENIIVNKDEYYAMPPATL